MGEGRRGQTYKQTDRQRQNETDTETEGDRETHRNRERSGLLFLQTKPCNPCPRYQTKGFSMEIFSKYTLFEKYTFPKKYVSKDTFQQT